MWRLFFLIERSYKLREPVLLVGETGEGKTTICQLLREYKKLRLHILNCHQYTEQRGSFTVYFLCVLMSMGAEKLFHTLGILSL